MPGPPDPIDPRDVREVDGKVYRGVMGSRSPMEMHPPRSRKPLPPMPLECPWCQSGNVDEDARVCRDCTTGLPEGAPTRKLRRQIRTEGMRIGYATRNQDNQRAYNDGQWNR